PRPTNPARLISATTVTASVLVPRLIVKEPAMGQRSILADRIEAWLEVISKSGSFCTARLARRKQVWLVRGVLYKAAAGRGVLPFHLRRRSRGGWCRR